MAIGWIGRVAVPAGDDEKAFLEIMECDDGTGANAVAPVAMRKIERAEVVCTMLKNDGDLIIAAKTTWWRGLCFERR